jgi:ketosteroid isomerase-like protein
VLRFLRDTRGGTLEALDELVAPDVVTRGIPGGSPTGRSDHRRCIEELDAAFAGMSPDVQALIAERDKEAPP